MTKHAHIAEDLRKLAVAVADLNPDPSNARRHGERNLDAIKASLAAFGQRKPLVVQRQGMIVRAGNGTLAAAQALGWDHIAAVVIDEDSAQAVQFAIADNRTAELAEWDDETLATLLDGMDQPTRDMLAFDDKELAGLMRGLEPDEIVEDEAPEPPADPITQPGDLWTLGQHRLLCGDSTQAEHVGKLAAGQTATLMVTDPPYGVDYQGGSANDRKRERLAGDADTEIFAAALTCALLVVPSGAWYVWHAGRHAEPVYAALRSCGYEARSLIVWNKLKAHYGAPSAHYCQKHEPCLYAVKGSANFCGPSNETSVWDIEQPHRNEFHPTQKPVECMARSIANHEAQIVYDPFLGSGTTLVAAEQLGRTCYGMEISPAYCDVIVERWENLTGQKAVRNG